MHIDLAKLELAQAKNGKTLAELGISKETIRNIRRGKNVRPTTVYKFAKALGCEVEDLIVVGGDVNGKESNSIESDPAAVH